MKQIIDDNIAALAATAKSQSEADVYMNKQHAEFEAAFGVSVHSRCYHDFGAAHTITMHCSDGTDANMNVESVDAIQVRSARFRGDLAKKFIQFLKDNGYESQKVE